MQRHIIVLHTGLSSDVVADSLLRSVEPKGVSLWCFLWPIAMVVQIASLTTGPSWNDASRQVIREVESRTFQLERRRRGPFSSTFYGSWQPENDGTKIEGYFSLPSRVKSGLRAWWSMVAAMALLGVVLNLLDLTAKTHFTVDPEIGLRISICILLLPTCVYLLVEWLGSRSDLGSLAYLKQNLSARTR